MTRVRHLQSKQVNTKQTTEAKKKRKQKQRKIYAARRTKRNYASFNNNDNVIKMKEEEAKNQARCHFDVLNQWLVTRMTRHIHV